MENIDIFVGFSWCLNCWYLRSWPSQSRWDRTHIDQKMPPEIHIQASHSQTSANPCCTAALQCVAMRCGTLPVQVCSASLHHDEENAGSRVAWFLPAVAASTHGGGKKAACPVERESESPTSRPRSGRPSPVFYCWEKVCMFPLSEQECLKKVMMQTRNLSNRMTIRYQQLATLQQAVNRTKCWQCKSFRPKAHWYSKHVALVDLLVASKTIHPRHPRPRSYLGPSLKCPLQGLSFILDQWYSQY